MTRSAGPVRRLWAQGRGFPPGRRFMLLPADREAAIAGLGLFDAVTVRQRLLAAAAPPLLRLGAPLPRAAPAPDPPPELWEGILEAVEPIVGRVGHAALRQPPNGRLAMLLLSAGGRPVGFLKVRRLPALELAERIERRLGAAQPMSFATPALLEAGSSDGWWWRLYEPLPAGRHRVARYDPARVHAVVSEWQALLEPLRTADVPAEHVLCHGDFTPRNLRVAADGRWWLFDVDNARWGPDGVDELHYACAVLVYGWRRPTQGRIAAVGDALANTVGAATVSTAAGWQGGAPRTYRAAEVALRTRVADAASESR